MGDAFLQGLAADLEQTQRALPPRCLFCVPQPRALLADEDLTQETLYTHFLVDENDEKPGEYLTLNGKQVAVVGSHIHTLRGFQDRRQVRILLSEKREIHHQEVTVLHISRPLEGGIQVPEDPSEIDVATFRKYTAILRSFPENELVFYQLDETISQVRKICTQGTLFARYEQTLPSILREEWEAAVEGFIRAGSFDDVEEDNRLRRRHGGGVGHLLQMQQVVECYLMENLHELIFPHVVATCQEQDKKLRQVMYRMRHYTPEDFGQRKEFQCFASEARDTLLTVIEKKTPLDMLLVFKSCIDHVSDAITQNVKRRRLDFEAYQLTTDDILDQLLFVLVQAFNQVRRNTVSADGEGLKAPVFSFPIAAVLKYISDYHFINSNTTALGFTLANFQVAIEYFLLRGDHEDGCNGCEGGVELQSGGDNTQCTKVIVEAKCVTAAHKIRRDLMSVVERVELARQDTERSTDRSVNGTSSVGDAGNTDRKLIIIGDWFTSGEDGEENGVDSLNPLAVHAVEFIVEGKREAFSNSKIIHVSGGQRFFAAVTEDGNLLTWGDSSGGRLGYDIAQGDPRRVSCPQQVSALNQPTITHVSCGGFHTLVTDLNGHVFAWGSNSKGQLGFLPSTSAPATIETPTVVADLRGTYMSSVACGDYHSLALSSDGHVFSWGCNKYGQLGRRTKRPDAAQPAQLETDWTGWSLDMKTRLGGHETSVVRRIAAGKDHSLAISSANAGSTWGRGDVGQLGHGGYMDVDEPKQVMAITATISDSCGLVDISGGNGFSLFLLQNGTVYICGRDPSLHSEKESLSPTLLTLPLEIESEQFGQIVAVSCGEAHYALLTKTGALLHSYGGSSSRTKDNADSSEAHERFVKRILEIGPVRRMVCGSSHTLAVI